jgi:hypothetical protein
MPEYKVRMYAVIEHIRSFEAEDEDEAVALADNFPNDQLTSHPCHWLDWQVEVIDTIDSNKGDTDER